MQNFTQKSKDPGEPKLTPPPPASLFPTHTLHSPVPRRPIVQRLQDHHHHVHASTPFGALLASLQPLQATPTPENRRDSNDMRLIETPVPFRNRFGMSAPPAIRNSQILSEALDFMQDFGTQPRAHAAVESHLYSRNKSSCDSEAQHEDYYDEFEEEGQEENNPDKQSDPVPIQLPPPASQPEPPVQRTPVNPRTPAKERSRRQMVTTAAREEEGSESSHRHQHLDLDSNSDKDKKICCNCKKSRCLKLYCDCFRNNKMCEGCNCIACLNIPEHLVERQLAMTALIQRDPYAFKPKILKNKHDKGCNCRKSGCFKKYCECFQAGLKCNELCKCEDCKNCGENHEHQNPESNPDIHNSNGRNRRGSTARKEGRMPDWNNEVY